MERMAQKTPYDKPTLLGNPCLRLRSEPVTQKWLDTDEFYAVMKSMNAQAIDSKDKVLTASQMGVNIRLMGFALSDQTKWQILANPIVRSRSRQSIEQIETSASLRHLHGAVKRAEWIELEAFDVLNEKRYEGATAIAVQIGMDHLDGILFIDRCSEFGYTYNTALIPPYKQPTLLGNPCLRVKSEPWTPSYHETDECKKLIRSMNDWTSYSSDIKRANPELTAPQMGVNIRLMNHPTKTNRVDYHVLVNPVERKRSQRTVLGPETSISTPHLHGLVSRAEWIEIESFDVDTKKVVIERFDGDSARTIQRGLDHLDGILFIDRCERDNFGFMYTHASAYTSQVNTESSTSGSFNRKLNAIVYLAIPVCVLYSIFYSSNNREPNP